MKKICILIFLVAVFFSLLFLNSSRYQTISETPNVKRYVDRWTQTAWVKEYTPMGVNRYPAQFYNSGKPSENAVQETLSELIKIRYKERIVTMGWYVLMILTSIFILYMTFRLLYFSRSPEKPADDNDNP